MTSSLPPTSLDKIDDGSVDTKMSSMLGTILGTISPDHFDPSQENNDSKGDQNQSKNETGDSIDDINNFKPKLTTDVEKLLNESTDTMTTTNTTLVTDTPNDSLFNNSPVKSKETKKSDSESKNNEKSHSSSSKENSPKQSPREKEDENNNKKFTETPKRKQKARKSIDKEESEYDYYYSDSDEEEKGKKEMVKERESSKSSIKQESKDESTIDHDILATGDLNISNIITDKLMKKNEKDQKNDNDISNKEESDKDQKKNINERELKQSIKDEKQNDSKENLKKNDENNKSNNSSINNDVLATGDITLSSQIRNKLNAHLDNEEKKGDNEKSPKVKDDKNDKSQELNGIISDKMEPLLDQIDDTNKRDVKRDDNEQSATKNEVDDSETLEETKNEMKKTLLNTLSALHLGDESDPTMDATEEPTESVNKKEKEQKEKELSQSNQEDKDGYSQQEQEQQNETNQDLEKTEVVAENLGTSSSTPGIPESCYLNLNGVKSLAPQDDKGPTYTYSMPGNLHKVVYHSPDSLVCKALAMCPLPPLPKDEKDSLVSDLSKYTTTCAEKGMIYEAAYVNQIKDTIKETPDFYTVKYDLKRCNENITYAEDEINAQKKFWENQRMMIQTEYETAMKELEMRHHQNQDMLDQEWQSTRKMQKYSKPSPQLLDLRYKTQRLITTKQFERAKQNGQKLAELEAIESEENTRKMNAAYRLADANLERKFQADCEVLKVIRDKKMDAATHGEERAFKPVNRRYEKLSAEKAKLQATADRGLPIPGKQIPQFSQQCNLPFMDLNSTPKLPLKKVTLIKRKKEESNKNQSRNGQKTPGRSQSSMAASPSGTPKPLLYRGERNNRSPTRLGQRIE